MSAQIVFDEEDGSPPSGVEVLTTETVKDEVQSSGGPKLRVLRKQPIQPVEPVNRVLCDEHGEPYY